ncbi:MAG: hypothetical protein K2Q24_05355 [Chitinophagaceae bacterium]|nr:hypothetical protein [Chitinophagaceae bacterium]
MLYFHRSRNFPQQVVEGLQKNRSVVQLIGLGRLNYAKASLSWSAALQLCLLKFGLEKPFL